jgi:hypothetical protein
MTTPPARGGQAKPVRTPGAPDAGPFPNDSYADLPATAKVSLRGIPPGRDVRIILDEDAPVLSGGGGGWVTTDRWGRKSITSWSGCQPYSLTFSGILDARFMTTKDGKPADDIERDVLDLEAWYAPRGDFNAPRHVQIVGASPGTDKTWLISDLAWKPSIRTFDGKRRIAPFDIVLLEFVDPDSVIRPTKRAQDASTRKRIYIVKPGDTLTSIAKNRLGDARRADDIRRANLPALGDARNLKKGMQILLPAGKLHRS